MASATIQGQLWGAHARDWAALGEQLCLPLLGAALDAAHVTAGTRLLDAGCGAGLLTLLAHLRGAQVTALDAAPALLFYIACWTHVDLHAIRLGLRGLSRAELPSLGRMMSLLYLFTPIIVLVWALVSGLSPFRAGALGIAAAMIAGLIAFRLGDFEMTDASAARLRAMEVSRRLLVRVVCAVFDRYLRTRQARAEYSKVI